MTTRKPSERQSRESVQARAEQLLEELVNIDSPTTNAHGVSRVQSVLARELGAMGFDVRFKPNPLPDVDSGDLLTATLQGEETSYITFVSHADTVLENEAYGGPFRREGKKAFGSGVIDNKGGLVVALEGLRTYLNRLGGAKPRFGLRLVSAPNEEGGSLGFHPDYHAYAKDSVMALGFEPALDDGSIIASRRGNRWYQVLVKGQEAHAGRCKGEQINAAHDLALKIAKLHKLNDSRRGLSVNIGQISGGRDRFNIVCGEVSAKLDARFATFATRDQLHRKIDRILKASRVRSPVTGRASETTYDIVDDCPPFSSTPASRKLARFYVETIEGIERRTVEAAHAGGAGDVNHMSREGVIVFDGLGPVGGSMHTTSEFIHLDSLSSRAQALSLFLEHAGDHLKARPRRFGLRRRSR